MRLSSITLVNYHYIFPAEPNVLELHIFYIIFGFAESEPLFGHS